MKKYLLSALFIFSSANCTAATPCKALTVYFVPLKTEYFTPLTSEDLRKNGKRVFGHLPKTCKLVGLIRSLQDGVDPKEQSERLRILIVDEEQNDTFLITAEKRVIFHEKLFDVDQDVMLDALREIKSKKDHKTR